MSHRLRDRPAVRAARKNRSARQPGRCADRLKTPPRAGASHFCPRSPRGERPPSRRLAGLRPRFLSTLPARGATATPIMDGGAGKNFYPRSPQEERPAARGRRGNPQSFLSTLPARGATWRSCDLPTRHRISIHAPRKRSDGLLSPDLPGDFLFLSTLPARGATVRPSGRAFVITNFYPRSPQEERLIKEVSDHDQGYFYPRSPQEERPGGETA